MSSTAKLFLSGGEVALIDAVDFHASHSVVFPSGVVWEGAIASRTWRAVHRKHTTYVVSTFDHWHQLFLHRAVMNAVAGTIVDHRNGNGLDCRRTNLRTTDKFGNAQNRRPNAGRRFKGVKFNSRLGKWEVRIIANLKSHYLGVFANQEEAAAAYDAAAKKLHGDFAKLNGV